MARTAYDKCVEDEQREIFRLPEVLETLLERESLGQKSGAGFYRKEGKEIGFLDFNSLEYRPRTKPRMDGIGVARRYTDAAKRAVAASGREVFRGLALDEVKHLHLLMVEYRALESGKTAFTSFCQADTETALAMAATKYDGIVYEMEHNPWDIRRNLSSLFTLS